MTPRRRLLFVFPNGAAGHWEWLKLWMSNKNHTDPIIFASSFSIFLRILSPRRFVCILIDRPQEDVCIMHERLIEGGWGTLTGSDCFSCLVRQLVKLVMTFKSLNPLLHQQFANWKITHVNR